ncbi:MAG: sensor histidine kinase [Nitrososphaerales archaeon]
MNDGQGHILVVDDNRMNRLKLARSLEQQGHVVASAEDGEQALAMLAEHQYDEHQYDAVLLDIVMPGLDGFQVLERIKDDKTLRDIPVIVISAVDEIDNAVRCIEIGAEDYLPKPFNPVLLRARLNASLQKKRLRDLEKAYLQQDVMLRQSEKLATLGRLSAGIAHELNNPAAAAHSGARQLGETFSRLQAAHLKLGELGLSDAELRILLDLDNLAQERARRPAEMSALARGDRDSELEAWLESQGVESPWEIAPALANLGYDCDGLNRLVAGFAPAQFGAVIDWLNYTYISYSLLEEIGQGTERISEIVAALKTYTFMDQAPLQDVDVHAGLDSTLVMLRNKLKSGITVHREYDPDLPRIQAYGSELNQVWTNIIDNAIDAMEGKGEITLRTRYDEEWVIVDLEDNGPGIPETLVTRIFDPFFTTKPPGLGTGMGLNISHSIVQKHRGRIEVSSRPGNTCFEVRLPRKPQP